MLDADVPNDVESAMGACCQTEEGGTEVECEVEDATECADRGGTFMAGTSCLPNPCAGAPPVAGDVVCCIPDDDAENRPECELRTQTECTSEGGIVIDGTSCGPYPCAPAPAAGDIQCCLPEDDRLECEDRTPEECDAQWDEHGRGNV